MKKFISTSPYQEVGELHELGYTAVENDKLNSDLLTGFPVLVLLNGYAKAGDEAELITLVAIGDEKGNKFKSAERNYRRLCEEAELLENEKNIKITMRKVSVSYDEGLDKQLKAFDDLLQLIGDNDELYADLTFGSKPTPIVEMLALNYGYRARQNVTIGCVTYGQFNHEHPEEKGKIYDITALLAVDEIVKNVADLGIENPGEYIHSILTEE